MDLVNKNGITQRNFAAESIDLEVQELYLAAAYHDFRYKFIERINIIPSTHQQSNSERELYELDIAIQRHTEFRDKHLPRLVREKDIKFNINEPHFARVIDAWESYRKASRTHQFRTNDMLRTRLKNEVYDKVLIPFEKDLMILAQPIFIQFGERINEGNIAARIQQEIHKQLGDPAKQFKELASSSEKLDFIANLEKREAKVRPGIEARVIAEMKDIPNPFASIPNEEIFSTYEKLDDERKIPGNAFQTSLEAVGLIKANFYLDKKKKDLADITRNMYLEGDMPSIGQRFVEFMVNNYRAYNHPAFQKLVREEKNKHKKSWHAPITRWMRKPPTYKIEKKGKAYAVSGLTIELPYNRTSSLALPEMKPRQITDEKGKPYPQEEKELVKKFAADFDAIRQEYKFDSLFGTYNINYLHRFRRQ